MTFVGPLESRGLERQRSGIDSDTEMTVQLHQCPKSDSFIDPRIDRIRDDDPTPGELANSFEHGASLLSEPENLACCRDDLHTRVDQRLPVREAEAGAVSVDSQQHVADFDVVIVVDEVGRQSGHHVAIE